jgi:hypothetical protein
VDALLAAFPGAIDHIERDAHFSITGEAQPEWLADEVPAAARQQRRRGLLAAAGRAQRRAAAAARRRLPEQADPTWNIDRVDQAALPLDHLYRYDHTGTGVNVWVALPPRSPCLQPAPCLLGTAPDGACGHKAE